MTDTPTCDLCGTDHDGWEPGSVGATMHCLRVRAAAIGEPIAGQAEILQARINLARDIATGLPTPGLDT